MLKTVKRAALHALQAGGAFRAIKNSAWRTNRLLILCYHGIAQADEHLWRPGLYMHPSIFEQRLEMLKRGAYNVLPLGKALQQIRDRNLPPRSVVLTFDDGGVDFYRVAFPLLRKYGFPATVYQTTYYSTHQLPVFNLMFSYLLWKRRGEVLYKGHELGLAEPMDLRTEESRMKIVIDLVLVCENQRLTGLQRHEIAAQLARILEIDLDDLLAKRLLQLMSQQEIAELASQGVDFQLHTHRHRAPINEALFRKEIRDNRESLGDAGKRAIHFCYPSGVYRQDFLAWLRAENIVSATTCETGLVTPESDPLLLPRFVDTAAQSPIEFESWLVGAGALLGSRKRGPNIAPPEMGRVSQAAAAE